MSHSLAGDAFLSGAGEAAEMDSSITLSPGGVGVSPQGPQRPPSETPSLCSRLESTECGLSPGPGFMQGNWSSVPHFSQPLRCLQ